MCTKLACHDHGKKFKKLGQLCSIFFNNCIGDLQCVKQPDGCNNYVGKCETVHVVKHTVPDLRPTPRPKTCIHKGGRCALTFLIKIEFSFRSSNNGRSCCNGLACVLGICMTDYPGSDINEGDDPSVKDEKCPWRDLDSKCLKSCHGSIPIGVNQKGERVCQCTGKDCDIPLQSVP